MTRSVIGLAALLAFALSSGAALACSDQFVQATGTTTKTVASAEGSSPSQTPIIIPKTGG